MTNGFDKLARPYRWLEYVTFGRALQRCRTHFLPEFEKTRGALVLGDGDGRFTAVLLRGAPNAQVTAVDGSGAMLQALTARCAREGTLERLSTVRADLGPGLPESLSRDVDLIATHFFLDCLSQAEVDRVIADASNHAADQALWVVSEFCLADSGVMRPLSALLVRALYAGFRVLTGLRTTRLPDHHTPLRRHGWRLQQQRVQLRGLLVSELWQKCGSTRMPTNEQ